MIQSVTAGLVSTNCYLLIDEKTKLGALIDCPCDSQVIDDMVENAGLERLQYILLTHGHYDHIMGLEKMKERTGAEILIHEQDAPCLLDAMKSLAVFRGCSHPACPADRLLRDGDTVTLGTLDIQVVHTPGHTLGGVCFVVEDAIFSGDTLFFETVGRTDLPGGSYAVTLESLRKLDALPGDYKIYPGHGRTSTLDYEREANMYFKEAR